MQAHLACLLPARCGHMSEETKNADVSAAYGIIIAIGSSALVGGGYILALLFSIQVGDFNCNACMPSASRCLCSA
jgi:hypothetical protein